LLTKPRACWPQDCETLLGLGDGKEGGDRLLKLIGYERVDDAAPSSASTW
jgi:hypothetical protein